MNQETMFTLNGKNYHITITPLMDRQLADLSDPDRGMVGLSAIIGNAVNRLHTNVAIILRPIPGQGAEVEVMPEGDPLPALCSLWGVRHQEVVKVALFDAWRKWLGIP